MEILIWIIVGLIAGVLAKAIMPGGANEPGGILGTILLGIVGAIVGGFLWQAVAGDDAARGISLGSILVATIGAIVVIALLRLFTRSSVA